MDDKRNEPQLRADHHETSRFWIIAAEILLVLGVGFLGGALAVRQYDNNLRLSSNGSVGQQFISSESELVASIAEEVGQSTVSISVESLSVTGFFTQRSFTQQSAGTGIILTEDGLVLTNKHVLPEGVTNVSVVLSDGTIYDDVTVVDRDPFNDIAFLQINGASGLVPAKLGDSSSVRVGETVIAIGNALGEFSNTVTTGVISGVGRPIVAGDGIDAEQLSNLFQTDAAINPGNSGGPLVNVNGQVIGVNTAVAGGGAENIGFSIPIDDVKPVLTSVKENSEIIRPYLGVRYVPLNASIAEQFDLEQTSGAYIVPSETTNGIVPDSPAAKAGLQEGDVITRVNNYEITNTAPLPALVNRYQVGETITLFIIRDGQEQTVQVELEAAPDSL